MVGEHGAVALILKLIDELRIAPVGARKQLLKALRKIVMNRHMLPYLQKSTQLTVKVLNTFLKYQENQLRDAVAQRLVKAWERGSFPLYVRRGGPPSVGDTPLYLFTSHRAHPKNEANKQYTRWAKPGKSARPLLNEARRRHVRTTPYAQRPPRGFMTERTHGSTFTQRPQVLETVRAHIREEETDIDPTVGPNANDCPPGWEAIAHRLVRLNINVDFALRFSAAEKFTYDFHGTRCWTPNAIGVEIKELVLSMDCRLWWDVGGRKLKAAITSANPNVDWEISSPVLRSCTAAGSHILRRLLEHHNALKPLELDLAKLSKGADGEAVLEGDKSESADKDRQLGPQGFSRVVGPIWIPRD